MDDKLRNKLNKMVGEFKSENTTENIRKQRNSAKITKDVQTMLMLKQKYARLEQSNPDQFKLMAKNNCAFLFQNFINIFNRLLKNELDLNILFNMIQILEKIENGEIDQHDGSYMVGEILKKMYVDSALKKEQKRKRKKVKKKPVQNKKLSWKDFKNSSQYEKNI